MAYAAVLSDYDANILAEQRCQSKHFELTQYLAGIAPANLSQHFPYEFYLNSSNWCSADGIRATLAVLDSFRPDSLSENRELLFNALTIHLEKRWEKKFSNYQPDTLISLAHWVARFYDYQEAVDVNDAQVFRIVSRYWFVKLSNALSRFSEDDTSIKYSFKFRYIVAICQSKGFSPPISNSMLEKTLIYFMDQNYGYLFHRFWNSTDWKFKAFSGLGLLTIFYGFVCIFKVHFSKNRATI